MIRSCHPSAFGSLLSVVLSLGCAAPQQRGESAVEPDGGDALEALAADPAVRGLAQANPVSDDGLAPPVPVNIDPSACTTPTLAPERVRVRIAGDPELVWAQQAHRQERDNFVDGQLRAYRDAQGRTHLTIPHYQNYRLTGRSLEELDPTPEPMFRSLQQADDRREEAYNYHHWLLSPYMADGTIGYALAHHEWYACLQYGDDRQRGCRGDNHVRSWVNALTIFRTDDGGASWRLIDDHVFYRPQPWPGYPYWEYPERWYHYGLMNPSNIILEGRYYYAFAHYLGRDASGEPDRNGGVLMRAPGATPMEAEVLDGTAFRPLFGTRPSVIEEGPNHYNVPSMTYNPDLCRYLIVFIDQATETLYTTTTRSLSEPRWSVPQPVEGQSSFVSAPAMSPGFHTNQYVTLLDPTSAGFNYEFSGRRPYLYYASRDPNDVRRRDLYRVQVELVD